VFQAILRLVIIFRTAPEHETEVEVKFEPLCRKSVDTLRGASSHNLQVLPMHKSHQPRTGITLCPTVAIVI
jgi:hypothetical protein